MSRKKGTYTGSLELICGPMFSGKTEELIRRLRRAQIAKQKVAIFKHAIDNRYNIECVTSHNGVKLNAHAIDNSIFIAEQTEQNNYKVVGIDEVQFFSNDIITTICDLIDNGTRVIAAGFDLDFRGVPFGPMPTLLAIADKVTKLQAICTSCGDEAMYTQRFTNNKPAKYNEPLILIGAEESYTARCRDCHMIDKPRNYTQHLQHLS
ncbi:thymidine kinase [Candidatus Dependentiae bacterium]|nr:MAG: thymidine kinase [Candidatus Dependentiae bacterium]